MEKEALITAMKTSISEEEILIATNTLLKVIGSRFRVQGSRVTTDGQCSQF